MINEEMKMFFEEQFKIYNEKITQDVGKLIASNFKIVNDRLDKIAIQMTDAINRIELVEKTQEDLKLSIDFIENQTEEKLKRMNEKTERMIRGMNDENNILHDRLRQQEDRARRNNLRIDGMKENKNENWEETEKKVTILFREELGIEGIQIERAHRTGKSTNTENNKPRTIVMKCLSYKDKQRILMQTRKLKNTGIYINEDFSLETTNIRKSLKVKMFEERRKGKYAIIKYDRLYVDAFRK
jgi:hypothetical protein